MANWRIGSAAYVSIAISQIFKNQKKRHVSCSFLTHSSLGGEVPGLKRKNLEILLRAFAQKLQDFHGTNRLKVLRFATCT